MVKLVSLMHRKPGLSMAEFIAYYEQRHVPLIERLLPFAADYRRNYAVDADSFRPSHGVRERPTERAFDVLTELTFADTAAFRRMSEALADPAIAAQITADEQNFLDRGATRSYVVEEHRSAS